MTNKQYINLKEYLEQAVEYDEKVTINYFTVDSFYEPNKIFSLHETRESRNNERVAIGQVLTVNLQSKEIIFNDDRDTVLSKKFVYNHRNLLCNIAVILEDNEDYTIITNNDAIHKLIEDVRYDFYHNPNNLGNHVIGEHVVEPYTEEQQNQNEYYFETPEHYDGQTDVIDFCEQHFNDEEIKGFYKFNILKYATRLGRKDDIEQELHKIRDYAQRYDNYLKRNK